MINLNKIPERKAPKRSRMMNGRLAWASTFCSSSSKTNAKRLKLQRAFIHPIVVHIVGRICPAAVFSSSSSFRPSCCLSRTDTPRRGQKVGSRINLGYCDDSRLEQQIWAAEINQGRIITIRIFTENPCYSNSLSTWQYSRMTMTTVQMIVTS